MYKGMLYWLRLVSLAVVAAIAKRVYILGEGNESVVQKIYDVLKNGAKIIHPLTPVDYSPLLADLIDKYGVCWCIFV